MSDTSQGHGWWQASDGKWYPPEAHPNYTPAPMLPQQSTAVLTPPAQSYTQFTQPVATPPRKRKKPPWRRWWAIALALLVGLVVIIAVAAPPEDHDADNGTSAQVADDAATAAGGDVDAADDDQVALQPAVPEPVAPETVAPEPAEEPESSMTPSQQNAVRAAQSYLDFAAFSRQGLIDQLSFEYGSQFPVGDATAAVDSLNVDWNEQAAKSAQSYLDFTAFSCQGLIDQLSSEYGSQFTREQATYGASQTGIC